MPPQDDSLLLVLPVPCAYRGGELHFEVQACNGADRWADNFKTVTLAVPELPASLAGPINGMRFKPVAEIPNRDRIRFVPLPYAYHPVQFFKTLSATRKQLTGLIDEHQYLHFAIGGLWGDWAAQAALVAKKRSRSYCIWTDRVEHEVVRRGISNESRWLKRFRMQIEVPLMRALEKRVIKKSDLGLFHGAETYEAYSQWCCNPHVVHDVHIKPSDHCGVEDVKAKAKRVVESPGLKLIYAGRASSEKGPMDWIRAVHSAHQQGATVDATWVGEGPMLEGMRNYVFSNGLGEVIKLPGFVESRDELMRMLVGAHVMLFAHLTPESPRCLVESIASGTPLVGYEGAYAKNLAPRSGVFVPIGDSEELSRMIMRLCGDKFRVREMMLKTLVDREGLHDEGVFGHRSVLMKNNLN